MRPITLKPVIIPFLFVFIFTSCSSPKNKVINRSSIQEDVEKLKKSLRKETADSNTIQTLDQLVSYSKDLDFFKKKIKEQIKGDLDLDKYLVDEETFKEMSDKLFKAFEEKKYTYKQLFKEVESINALQEDNYNELLPVYKQIDSICQFYQKKIDETLGESDKIKDSLNKMVSLELVSIRQTEIDYSDVVAVQVRMTNRTEHPIEAISFELELTDKLGNKVATLNCKSNDRFVQSNVSNWTYKKYDLNDIYKSLENITAAHVSTKFRIKKINVDGKLIGSEIDNLDLGEYFEYSSNKDYKTPTGKLRGYCPYLKSENPFGKKVSEIDEKVEKEIEKGSFPIYKLIEDFNIFDFK